jgi:hypothetical protein
MSREAAIDAVVYEIAHSLTTYGRRMFHDVYKQLRGGLPITVIQNQYELMLRRYVIMHESSPEFGNRYNHTAGYHRVERSMHACERILKIIGDING